MMKYVIVHPDHFTSPTSAFFIGFACMWNIMIAEYLNMYVTITIDDYKTLLASFITYRIQQQIPQLYMDSKKPSSLKPKADYINSRPLNIARKKWRKEPISKYNKGCTRYTIELLFSISYTIYISLYFYFSPFLVTIYPIFMHGFLPYN